MNESNTGEESDMNESIIGEESDMDEFTRRGFLT